jgi:predicted transposase/invertase (TIGR01784 family)
VKEVEQAIEAYKRIAGSDEYRELERVRERARHDEAQALWNSWQKGMNEGLRKGREDGWEKGRNEGRNEGRNDKAREIAINGIKAGFAPEAIAQITGLSLEEVLALGKNAE